MREQTRRASDQPAKQAVDTRHPAQRTGSPAAVDGVLALQRTAGNAAVSHALAGRRMQRHTSVLLEYEPDSVQRRSDVAVQRHTSVPLEYEPDSIQRQAVPGPVVLQRSLIDKLNKAMDGWGTDEDAMRAAIAAASATDKQAALRDPRLLRRMADELNRDEMREMLEGLGAPLSMRLEASMAGWGADSAEILKMCRSAPAPEKLAVLRNPALMARLRDELSQRDAVAVMVELDAPIAQRLYAAMDGWGVDTNAILAICRDATAEQKREAARDRALIDRLKDQITQPAIMHSVLEQLGVSLIDRLHAAMDGWGVDSVQVLNLASRATAAEKAAVLRDAATVARLRDELSNADMLSVLRLLDASIADRLNVALDGWGVAPETVHAIIEGSSEAQRMAAYGDTELIARIKADLEPDDARKALLLLRFGSQAAIDAATPEELEAEKAPENLIALLSASLTADPPDTAKMLTDITAAGDEDKALVRGNTELMRRLRAAFPDAQRGHLQHLLGVGIVDRLNTLVDQGAAAGEFVTLVSGATEDDKQAVLTNRPLIERLTDHLGADVRTVLGLLGDTLVNQLRTALDQGGDVPAMLALIEAAPQDERDAARVHSVLLGDIAERLTPVDTWKIRLHLEYGTAAAYPPGVPVLMTVLTGHLGFAVIRQTIANMSEADFAATHDVVGLREVLRTQVDDTQYVFLLRMLDQGLINEETINETYSETLQNDDPDTPGNIFEPMVYTGTGAFDVAQMRDRLQVDMRIKMNAGDDGAKSQLSAYESRLEPLIEGIWDNKYSLRNSNRTIPVRINCNFTSGDPHHTINVYAKSTGVKYGEYNLSNWYPDATGFSALAPAHEFGHMLGNRDEYNLSSADYISTVGTDPTTDGATKETDDAGNERFTNRSIMGSNVSGQVDPRHLNYFVNWINRNRRKKADGTFLEPAFSLV